MAYPTVCAAQRLPVELLCSIFDYLQEEYVNVRDPACVDVCTDSAQVLRTRFPYSVAWVCRLWRDAVGSEARFWTWINAFVNDPVWTPAYLDEEIRWSRDGHGLKLTVLMDPGLPNLPESMLRARMGAIMEILRESTCLERCVGVRINVATDTPIFGPLSRLIGVNESLTRLNLSSQIGHPALTLGDPGIRCTMANLRALTIDGYNLVIAHSSQSLRELSLTDVAIYNYPPPIAATEPVDEAAMLTQLLSRARTIAIRRCEFSSSVALSDAWPQRRMGNLSLEDLSSATVLCIWKILDNRYLDELTITNCGLPTLGSRYRIIMIGALHLNSISAREDMASFLEDIDMYHLRVTDSPALNNRVLEIMTNAPPGSHESAVRCISLGEMHVERCNNWTIYALRSMVKRRNQMDHLGYGLWKVTLKDVAYRLTPYDISWFASQMPGERFQYSNVT
ncbi:hypothetical protein CCMSSC00406_0009023 [Pleurotus cornucopiae]|uniref:Uncharacterized protein n=1 Tax=Pleurotus cornucopiae TaxID=5321 RepID=A0ACB7IVC5_PLECO|nr:hypothetical protein CCMSSC00406_0009023 [Pleurotus cornucopiae]